MALRVRDVPLRMANGHFGVRDRAFRGDRRRTEVKLVIGGDRPGVAYLVAKEDAEMRAAGDQIALASDAAADSALREVRGQRDAPLPLLDQPAALRVLAPIVARFIGVEPAGLADE